MALDMLQPVEGDGVLARFGDLTLLCDGGAHFERQIAALIDLVTDTARAGGDGRRLGRRLAALLLAAEDDGIEYPSLFLAGPLGGGLAVLVHGLAVADVSSNGQTVHLDGSQSVTWVDRRFTDPVDEVKAVLGSAAAAGTPDRWSRLDGGVVRASALVLSTAATLGRPSMRVPIPEQAVRGDEKPSSFERVIGAADSMHASERVAANFGRGGFEPSRVSAAAAGLSAVGLSGPSLDEAGTDSLNGSSVLGTELADEGAGRRLTLLRQPQDSGSGDVVTGVYCENGHFNPSSAEECAVCDTSLSGATESGPRPPLGILTLDDGPIHAVSSDFIVGREPDDDEDVRDGRAQPFRINQADGHLASVHARVSLDGWTVRLIDLGTPGGTHVCPPGGSEWSRVMPHVPTPIRPGSKLLFGRTCVRFDPYRVS
jgi:hypothetical protein